MSGTFGKLSFQLNSAGEPPACRVRQDAGLPISVSCLAVDLCKSALVDSTRSHHQVCGQLAE